MSLNANCGNTSSAMCYMLIVVFSEICYTSMLYLVSSAICFRLYLESSAMCYSSMLYLVQCVIVLCCI